MWWGFGRDDVQTLTDSAEIKPFVTSDIVNTVRREIGGNAVWELTEESALELLKRGRELQARLSKIDVEERLALIDSVGKIWQERLQNGVLEELAKTLSENTGYSRKLVDMELSLVPQVLNASNIRKNLEASFKLGLSALERFVELTDGEYFRYVPVGPVFIISAGNSLIPPLIPTTLSLITGNFTLLRPSVTNYCAVVDVYKPIRDLAESSDAAKLFSEALVISYFTHESPTLKRILTSGCLGLVNFWGGEPARTVVEKLVSDNPHHPRYLVNGPLTGFAIVDEKSADDMCARGLALNVILYDQQLCSSPTMAVFIGSWNRAIEFVERVGRFLDDIGSGYRFESNDDYYYTLQSVRRMLQMKGSKVYSSNRPDNMWTLILSSGKSQLEDALAYFPAFNIYNRKRFLEIVVVDSLEKATEQVANLPSNFAFTGVDGVQTVGLAVEETEREKLLDGLAKVGVYRITPIEDMYMRSPVEPYDGIFLASTFTYTIYSRKKTIV